MKHVVAFACFAGVLCAPGAMSSTLHSWCTSKRDAATGAPSRTSHTSALPSRQNDHMQRSGDDYYDVLLGARYTFGLSDRWSIVTHGELSFGDSEGTYLLRANFAFSVGKQKQNNILFGYQFKSAEFKDGDVSTDFT
jgi:hypothetical protein